MTESDASAVRQLFQQFTRDFADTQKFPPPKDIARKQGRDIVAATDRAIEAEIVAKIRCQFPEHAILSEESGRSITGISESDGLLWVIDPVEGTVNFVSGFPFFGVSIALLEEGLPCFGMVALPALSKTYFSERGCGAFCNGKRLQVSTTSDLSNALVSIMLTSHYTPNENHRATRLIEQANLSCRGVRVLVCEAAELAMIAEGVLDGNLVTKADPYGAFAGMLLIQEAGGRMSDFDGKLFGVGSSTIVASNGILHDSFIDLTCR